MACTVTNMNVTLPPLHTLFPASSLPSPSPSPTTHDDLPYTSVKTKAQHNEPFPMPRLPFPLAFPSHVHNRRVSTNSLDSDASAPSLVCSPSPSPSPPPTRPCSPTPFLLIPCELGVADAVVVVSLPSDVRSTPAASSRPLVSPIFRPCKPSEARATLLIGPAISAHARKRAAAGQRRMHPYRIVHDRRGIV